MLSHALRRQADRRLPPSWAPSTAPRLWACWARPGERQVASPFSWRRLVRAPSRRPPAPLLRLRRRATVGGLGTYADIGEGSFVAASSVQTTTAFNATGESSGACADLGAPTPLADDGVVAVPAGAVADRNSRGDKFATSSPSTRRAGCPPDGDIATLQRIAEGVEARRPYPSVDSALRPRTRYANPP